MFLPLAKLFLRLMAFLPLRANHALGSLLGWLCWVLPNRNRHNTLVNLQLCFPEMKHSERQAMARASLIETGKALTETGWLWYRDSKDIQNLIEFPEQQIAFAGLPKKSSHENCGQSEDSSQSKDSSQSERLQSTLLITPHFGAWEMCPAALAPLKDPVYLYRPPRAIALEPLIKTGRERFGAEMVAVDAAGIKNLLRAVRRCRPVGILPDQEPDANAGIFANFFGVPANTMTLLPRLAGKSSARVVCLAIERKPKGRGFLVHNVPVEPGILEQDISIATKALNQTVEHCVKINPNQYCWSYRRFRLQPDGSRRDYSARAIWPVSHGSPGETGHNQG